jgi:hypothetical protein
VARPKPRPELAPEKFAISLPQRLVIAAYRFQNAHPTTYPYFSALMGRALENLLEKEAPGLIAEVEREIAASPLDYSEKIPLQERVAKRKLTPSDLAGIAARIGTEDTVAALARRVEAARARGRR